MPVTTSNTVAAADYNATYALIEDVLGLGENGWGLPLLTASPVSPKKTISAYEYNNLLKDINVAHTHITNANTSTTTVTTGSSVLTASYANALSDLTNWLRDSSRRYTCHPNQYFLAQLAGGGTTNNLIPAAGTSLRTGAWGSGTNSSTVTASIIHKAISAFRSSTAARYYFNQGNFLTFTPFYQGAGLNDLDAEWANFIDWINTIGDNFTYGLSDYVSGNKVKEWNSGSLYVHVLADKSGDQSRVNFEITFGNTANPNLQVSPAVGLYRVVIPSGLSLSYGRVNSAFMFATFDERVNSIKSMPLRKFNHRIINPKLSQNPVYSKHFKLSSVINNNKSTGI